VFLVKFLNGWEVYRRWIVGYHAASTREESDRHTAVPYELFVLMYSFLKCFQRSRHRFGIERKIDSRSDNFVIFVVVTVGWLVVVCISLKLLLIIT
jgi:hypothetical protein